MTLNTQRDSKETLRRRASTPIPSAHQSGAKDGEPAADPHHPALGHSASYHPGDKTLHSRASWSTDSEDSDSSGAECLYRVVLLGDHGVGKSSLATIFAGIQEKDLSDQEKGEDTYERTLTVDGEETTLIVMDTWEAEKQVRPRPAGGACLPTPFLLFLQASPSPPVPEGQQCCCSRTLQASYSQASGITSGGGREVGAGLLHAGGQRLRHRVLHHGSRQLRERLRAAHPAAAPPAGRGHPHHPGGEQERPGALP
nr:PREDICTED: GTP-binding protein REM 1-like isoform X3 [Lepisosteus oculatus]